MKLGEMADLLCGLADTMEKFMGKNVIADMREVSECFRKHSNQNVKSFCAMIEKANNGKNGTTPTNGKKSENAIETKEDIEEYSNRIKQFLENRDEYSYAQIHNIATEIKRLKKSSIESIGKNVGCPVFGTKTKMLEQLKNWLINIKRSADKTSFA